MTAKKPEHPLVPADRVNGTDVYSKAGDRLGKIEDVAIEKVSGTVAYAILSFGGVLGLGSHYHPVPWKLLKYDPDKRAYVVPLKKEDLEKAPAIDETKLVRPHALRGHLRRIRHAARERLTNEDPARRNRDHRLERGRGGSSCIAIARGAVPLLGRPLLRRRALERKDASGPCSPLAGANYYDRAPGRASGPSSPATDPAPVRAPHLQRHRRRHQCL